MSKKLGAAAIMGCAVLALVFLVTGARAETFVDVPCSPLAEFGERDAFKPLTHDQWIFARALFVSAPKTPMALPPGDSAVLRKGANGQGVLLFIDGDQACAPIVLSADAIELLDEVARGSITHPPSKM